MGKFGKGLSIVERLYFNGNYYDIIVYLNDKDEYDGEYKFLDHEDKSILRYCLFKQDRRYGIDIIKLNVGLCELILNSK